MLPPDSLQNLLDRWRAPEGAFPDLRPAIRNELARRSSDRAAWWPRLDEAFRRPSFAITFVTACVLLGLFLAETRVSRLHAANGAQIARSYVQLIDPLLAAAELHPQPARSP